MSPPIEYTMRQYPVLPYKAALSRRRSPCGGPPTYGETAARPDNPRTKPSTRRLAPLAESPSAHFPSTSPTKSQ